MYIVLHHTVYRALQSRVADHETSTHEKTITISARKPSRIEFDSGWSRRDSLGRPTDAATSWLSLHTTLFRQQRRTAREYRKHGIIQKWHRRRAHHFHRIPAIPEEPHMGHPRSRTKHSTDRRLPIQMSQDSRSKTASMRRYVPIRRYPTTLPSLFGLR